jgi:hypothetical protein
MPNRREFIRSSLQSAAIATIGLPYAQTAADVVPRAASLYRVLYDRRLAGARLFASTVTRLGAKTACLGDDLGPLWMNLIEPRLREGSAVLAGLTRPAPLFCLEFLCRDYGMRLLYRAEHRRAAADRMSSVVTGNAAAEAYVPAAFRSVEPWPVIAGTAAIETARRFDADRAIDTLDLSESDADSVYSWVIVPRPTALG